MPVQYLPIPEGVPFQTVKVTKTISVPSCQPFERTITASVTGEVRPSTKYHEYTPILEHRYRVADTSGRWSQIRASNTIKMTPMSAGTKIIKSILGKVDRDYIRFSIQHVSNDLGHRVINGRPGCYGCTINFIEYVPAILEKTYTEQGDLTYWRNKFPKAPYYKVAFGISDKQIQNKVESIKGSAMAELLKGYDLAEELLEFKETVREVQKLLNRATKLCTKFVPTLKEAVNSIRNPKELGNLWMEFRYGIMPIYYSYLDITKTFSDPGEFKTTRRKLHLTSDQLQIPSEINKTHFVERGSIDKTWRVTCKGHWPTPAIKKLDRINFNLLTGAARVYPYAFVVRWFINLNDFIENQVKSLTTNADQIVGCVALRSKTNINTFMRYLHSDQVTLYKYVKSYCGENWYPAYGPFIKGKEGYTDILLREEREDVYERTLFQPKDIGLVFSPHLDWKRFIDATVLSSRTISKTLRSLL